MIKIFFLCLIILLNFGSVMKTSAETPTEAINAIKSVNLDLNSETGIFSDIKGIFEKITDFLSKIAEPVKGIIKAIGNLIIWILELTIKLIKWGLSYLQ